MELLATLRFDIYLKQYELDEKSATNLCHYEGDADVEGTIFHALKQYVNQSKELFQNDRFIQIHDVLGQKLSIVVETETKTRYLTHIKTFVFFT